jgi:hypothetical protein
MNYLNLVSCGEFSSVVELMLEEELSVTNDM